MKNQKFRNLFYAVSLFIISPCFSQLAISAPEIVSYSTDYETHSKTATSIKIYAGRTNNAASSSCSTAGTCNTCDLDTAQLDTDSVCGKYEVLPANTISFVIKSASTTIPVGTIGKMINTSATGGATVDLISPPAYAVNSNMTFTTTWSEICGSASPTASATCESSFSNTFKVGFNTGTGDLTEYIEVEIHFRYVNEANVTYHSFACLAPKTGEGFCYFDIFPGDEKVYITPTFNENNTTAAVSDFATGMATAIDPSGIKYKYIRVLYIQGNGVADTQSSDVTRFTQALPTKVDLPITDLTNVTISPNSIKQLQNQDPMSGNAYLFLIASVDEAGLVTNYTDPTDANLCRGTNGNATQFASLDTQCGLPQKVFGLLDGQSCFIATATYGTSMAEEVEAFRQFRGEYLLQSKMGRLVVHFYNQFSPPLAELIAQNDGLRLVSRIFLLPILLFVKLALLLGMLPAILISLVSLFLLCVFAFRMFRSSRIKL